MGMDLEAISPSAGAPRNDSGEVIWGRYNWAGWTFLIKHLEKWGVDLSEFSGSNDGDILSAETCMKVANAIEEHLPELTDQERKWLEPHIRLWRTCGGYRQL